MNLRCLTDDLLAGRAATGDDRAFAELERRYRGLIRFVARWAPPGITREELRQEALMGLFEACRAHDPSKGTFAAMADACVRHRVWRSQLHARRAKHRVLTEAVALDHRDGPDGDGEQPTIAERLPARDGADPAHVVEVRERLAELAAALRALTPSYRDALRRDDEATAKRRWHARRRLGELLDQGPAGTLARRDGCRFSEAQIRQALALVADGKSLHEAAAAVGTTHQTVMRWRDQAA